MTCIVALEAGASAWIGCDSFLGTALELDATDRPKFFRKGPLVIGYAGSVRGAQVVEYAVKLRRMRRGESEMGYLVGVVSAGIQRAFAKAGASSKANGQESTDTDFVVCLRGRVYMVQSDYSVIRSPTGMLCIGSGRDYALGALLGQPRAMKPAARVLAALKASAALCPQVCGPFTVTEAK